MPGAPETTLMADATPRLPARHQALLDSLPSAPAPDLASRPSPERSFGSAQADGVSAPPRGYANGPRTAGQMQAPDTYERDAYNRDADTREADNRDADERDNFDRGGTEARGDADAGYGAPSRYADAATARAYDRGDDGYGDNAGDNSGDRDGTDNGPTADNAPGAYRNADAPDAYGSPAHPRLVPGPDGRWYLLLPYGR
jgi:hypothetical protein